MTKSKQIFEKSNQNVFEGVKFEPNNFKIRLILKASHNTGTRTASTGSQTWVFTTTGERANHCPKPG